MKQKGKLPDFLIIGAMKSGTTSLHDYLGKHPEIYTSEPKEIHYFMDENFNTHSLDWYKSLFITEKKIAGTSPQNYTKCHRPAVKIVPERIFKYMPNVKLIYIVRDPVKRIVSHYTEAQSGGYAPKKKLNAFLNDFKNNHYVQTSMYYYQISQYLKFFKKEQILIVKSENLLNNRLKTLNEVFRFLSVKEITDSSIFEYEKNIGLSKQKKSNIGELLFNSDKTKFIRRVLPRKFKDRLKNRSIVKNISFNSVKPEQLDIETERKIRNYLLPDIKKLETFSGINFKDWY